MNRRVWTGVIAGVLAATVLLTVGIGSYRAGQDDEVVARTVSDGEAVRVVEHHGWGFFPGFFLFPLLVIGLIVLLARGRRGYGWHRSYGPGFYGGYGPGPCGAGGYDLQVGMHEWHRRMHEGESPADEGDTSAGEPPDGDPTPPAWSPGSGSPPPAP